MVENILDLVDHVLVMTVNPGFGGQAYIPTMVDKIRKIRKWGVDRGLDFDIEVDGGVKVSDDTWKFLFSTHLMRSLFSSNSLNEYSLVIYHNFL